MENVNLLQTYANADYADRQTLEKLFGKDSFKKLNYYTIREYYMPSLSNDKVKHIQSASCFTDSQFGGNSEWKIYSIKRLYDNKNITIGDYLNFNDMGKGTLTEIQFESAPIDKGTRKLCFVSNHETLGKWWQLSDLEHTTKPLFTTDDDVEINIGTPFYAVHDFKLIDFNGKPFTADENTHNRVYQKYFYNKENAEDYIKLHYLLQPIKDMLIKQNYLCYGELVNTTLDKIK